MATRSGSGGSLGSPSMRSSTGISNLNNRPDGDMKVQKFGDMVTTTLRDIKVSVEKVINVNVDKNNNNTNASIKISPFGTPKDRVNNMEAKLEFSYNHAEKGVDGTYYKLPTKYTPDLSKAVLNRFQVRVADTFFPAALKLQANKDEFNNFVFIDAKDNVSKIACPIYRNQQHQECVLFEQPEHTVQQRGLFLVRHPNLCVGDSSTHIVQQTATGEVSVLIHNPFWEFLELNRTKGNIKSVSHPTTEESSDTYRIYRIEDYDRIMAETLERRNRVLNVMDMRELNFTLSRVDGNSLADPVGTAYQLNPNDFHNIKNFSICIAFEFYISVVVPMEYLDAGMMKKLVNCPCGVDIGSKTILSIPGLRRDKKEKEPV